MKRTPTLPAPATLPTLPTLPKSPTGITGLDEITGGGLPRGRPTLVCGAAQLGEPGVFMMFEENARELMAHPQDLRGDRHYLQLYLKVYELLS